MPSWLRSLFRWLDWAWKWAARFWPLVGTLILTAWAVVVAFVKALPAEAAVPLIAATGAFASALALALYSLSELICRRIVRRRIAALIGEADDVVGRAWADHASRARVIDDWRARVGRLPLPIHQHVLNGGDGDLITLPLQRLREVSRDLPRWFDL